MKRAGMGMAWRGALCAGLMIALGACGGPPRHDGHPGGSDDDYSEGPRDHGKHDGDGDSDGDDLRPSPDWQKPGDVQKPSDDGISWHPGGSSGDDGNTGGANEETNGESGDEYVCEEKVIVPIALEGQIAPGTCDSRFDPTTLESVYGFHDPQTNEHGDVAFRGSYTGIVSVTGASTDTLQPTDSKNEVCEPYGAGIFAWDNDDGHMRPVAISGQRTEAGYLPPIEDSFSGPALNDADQIAFSVRELSGGSAYSALFLGNVEHRGLELIAKQGDEAPRGGVFDKFYDVSISRDGEVAFIASFANDLVETTAATDTKDVAPTVLPEPPPEGYTGVYVAKDGCHGDIKAIARFGDYLEGTHGGRLCGVAGPWISDYGDVLFQATCIFGGDQFRQGSLFIHRHDDPDHDVDPFLMIGDTVAGGSIGTINVGRPGMNDEEVALRMTVIGPPPAGYHQVIATKKIGHDEGDDCEPRICTQDFDYVHHYGTLLVAFDDLSIAQDGTIAFGGTFGYQVPGSMEEVTTDSQPVGERSAILTCRDGEVKVIAEQGDRKPLPKDFVAEAIATALQPDSPGDARCTDGNAYDFRFGYLDQPSNANGHVVFRDSSEYPTGIFLSEPYCGD